MATTLQDRFFAALDERATAAGVEVLTPFTYVNTGTAEIVATGGFASALSFTFHFQTGHNVFEAQVPVWGGSNPRMEIARGAADIGTVIDKIMVVATRQAGKGDPRPTTLDGATSGT